MSLLRALFGPSKDEVWNQLAREIGGTLVDGGWSGTKVQAQTGDWIVTLDTFTQSTGKNSTPYTRIRAPFVNRDGFRFTIYRSGVFTELGKFFGMQDVEIGDLFFDQAFVVQSIAEPKVRELFANPRIRELLLCLPAVYLTIRREDNWLWGPRYPEGVDVLYFHTTGVITDLGVLHSLYELFAEVLNHLCHLDTAYADDVGLHIRSLTAPGGRVEAESVVLWEGDPPRRAAAQALGRLQARAALPYLLDTLQDPDPLLRANVAWAIGMIGERVAAPALLRLLGDETRIGVRTVKEFAVDALRQLGEGGVAAAFDAALTGDTAAVETLRKLRRPELTFALTTVLQVLEPDRAGRAAWMLGELGAVEALGAIKTRARQLRRAATTGELELMTRAIQQLERQSVLPRPASSPEVDRQDLPRPAAGPDDAGDCC